MNDNQKCGIRCRPSFPNNLNDTHVVGHISVVNRNHALGRTLHSAEVVVRMQKVDGLDFSDKNLSSPWSKGNESIIIQIYLRGGAMI